MRCCGWKDPDAVLAQGDTTTVMTVALASFYNAIPFGHVEAGLRTGDIRSPFPEEANRVIAGRLACWHFAPTESARLNLQGEGVKDADIFVTGNTVIDALLMTASREPALDIDLDPGRRLLLVTAHRRENFGEPFSNICRALRTLAERNADIQILYPVHPNPNVKDVAHRMLNGCRNIILSEPLNYAAFIAAMKKAYLIISDSGGVQEEAPALGKPVLVLREETERPEAVTQGVVRLVGTDPARIVEEGQRLLDDASAYRSMARGCFSVWRRSGGKAHCGHAAGLLQMRQLVYLSPLPWSGFAQRPHKFVEWFHKKTGGDVLWVEPYPTRFPAFSDFRRARAQRGADHHQRPSWMEIVHPAALPIEPLPASGLVNGFIWRSALKRIEAFAKLAPTLLAIGKPSVLALAVAKRLCGVPSVYDAMDDFPSFYGGLSRLAMRRRERDLVGRMTHLLVSSTALKNRWQNVRPDVHLALNALDAVVLPAPRALPSVRDSNKIFGYVGTIGSWFDWEWVMALARARRADVVRLVGPMFAPAPQSLPANIEILPPLAHPDALRVMRDFDVGLIPFKSNDLTASVDPIKYYEYHALGLPVISTEFGEMILRKEENGVFLSKGEKDLDHLIQKAMAYRADEESIRRFIACNTWAARFEALKIIP